MNCLVIRSFVKLTNIFHDKLEKGSDYILDVDLSQKKFLTITTWKQNVKHQKIEIGKRFHLRHSND